MFAEFKALFYCFLFADLLLCFFVVTGNDFELLIMTENILK
jgi:hypothetical protein